MTACARWVVVWAAFVIAGCGDDAPPIDVDGSVVCSASSQCDDGVFCNGAERCMPGVEGADTLGCVPGAPPCEGSATCNESADSCLDDCPDLDGDGSPDARCGGDDCDDSDPNRYPGATEVCDPEGFDEDCDPTTVGGRDVDGDGHTSDRCCNGATCGTDCDDARRGTNPTVPEVCDGLDNDCDGLVDEGLLIELFRDADHDGVGIREATALACPGTPGFASAAGDCDDTRASVRPTAPEICDDLDNDCDGVIDENTVAVPWYVDADGDGWGIVNADALPVDSCVPPEGRAIRIGDCNDDDADIAPTAPERCNAIDDDCDGRPDYLLGARDFEDDDGDGVPDAACGPELADCDDRDPTIAPDGRLELCDLFDNDCDGVIDEDAAERDWFGDMDGDGYGDASSVVRSCAIVSGRTLDDSDCDDVNSSTNPGRSDACGGQVSVDDDCDEAVDEGGNALTFYADLDGDGYGSGAAIVACQGDARTATRGGDCDDTDARVNPGELDDCAALSEVDDDCDGRVDETLTPRVFYADGDGDGYGAGAPTEGCVQPVGTSVLGGDCDDTSTARNPGVPDDCGTALGVDDDCDVSVDEDVAPRTFYVDRDGDGFGAGPASMACVVPAGSVTTAGDCDDVSATRNPAAPDDCTRTPLVDDDCDGRIDEAATLTSWYRDTDGDGYGSGAAVVACTAPTNHVNRAGDCDESRVAVNPGAADGCTGITGVNDDCDASTDEAVMLTAWYPDADGDGYGVGSAVLACTAPSAHVARSGDCDDTTRNRNPGRADDCSGTASLDDDCDTRVDEAAIRTTYYRDSDGDTFGDPAFAMQLCGATSGWVSNPNDCDDTRSAVRPTAAEVCANGLDDDCDTLRDCADDACSASCGALEVVSGSMQSAAIHALYPEPLRVRVTDGLGAGIAGRTVTLSTTGISASPMTTTTDAMGYASFAVRGGFQVGAETFRVTAFGVFDLPVVLSTVAPADRTIFSVFNGPRAALGIFTGPTYLGSTTSLQPAIAGAPDGSIYLVASNRIFRVRPDGALEKLAGTGSLGSAAPAPDARLVQIWPASQPILVDAPRNRLLYAEGCQIFAIDLSTCAMTLFMGTGGCGSNTGDGGLAIEAASARVGPMAATDTGVVFFITTGSSAGPRSLRYVDSAGRIDTILNPSYVQNGISIGAFQSDLAAIPGEGDEVYFSTDCTVSGVTRECLLRVDTAGALTFVAGGSDTTSEPADARLTSLGDGVQLAVLSTGEIVLGEDTTDRIRIIDSMGIARTISGTRSMPGDTGDGGPASMALIRDPSEITIFGDDHIAFPQVPQNTIRAIW